jgi:hypothetical protein
MVEQRFRVTLLSGTPSILHVDGQAYDLPTLLNETIDIQLQNHLALGTDTLPLAEVWRAYTSEPRFVSVNGRVAFQFTLNILGDGLRPRDLQNVYSGFIGDINTKISDLLFGKPVQGLLSLSGPIEFYEISVGPR